MTTTRRLLTLAGLIVAAIVGSTIPASATFADSAAVATAIGTHTVQAPTRLVLNDYCVTATTTVRRTVYTNPTTGVQTQTAYSSNTTTATSTSNVQSSTTTTNSGPGWNETTTTTVTKNTTLYVSLSWTASSSPRVTGYAINAHLGIDGSVVPMLTTTGTSVTQSQDADSLYYQPRLSVTTQTSYGWTATSPTTALITC